LGLHQQMGLTQRLGQAIRAQATPDQIDSLIHAHTVSWRDKDRPHPTSGADDCTDALPVQEKPGEVTAAAAQRTVLTYETGFGTPDGWAFNMEPEVCRQSESARMGNPMAVDQDGLGRAAGQTAQRLEEDRCLSEPQQARNVREGDRPAYDYGLEGDIGLPIP
jgi:hypothetical protein